MKRKEKLENLIDELEILNFDIRNMRDCQIRQYLQLKFKLLDFISVVSTILVSEFLQFKKIQNMKFFMIYIKKLFTFG